MERFNIDEDTPIENKTLSKAIENAQTSVESRNFQYRKSTLEYDDVMNKQREIIYGQRKQVLDGMDIKPTILNMLRSSIESQVACPSHGRGVFFSRAGDHQIAPKRCASGRGGTSANVSLRYR